MNCVAERKLKINEKEIFESKELGITDSVDEEQKKLFEKYQKFLESSVYVDLYDLLNFYKDQCSSLDEEVKCLNDKSFIIFDYPVNVVEVSCFYLWIIINLVYIVNLFPFKLSLIKIWLLSLKGLKHY